MSTTRTQTFKRIVQVSLVASATAANGQAASTTRATLLCEGKGNNFVAGSEMKQTKETK